MFEAQDLINQAIKRHRGHIAVACSFGKDSMVVLHMALKADPNIPVIFENTGVEFPETIHMKNLVKDKWNLNLYETTPIKTFWECADEYGLPSSKSLRGEGSSTRCCYYLKERPSLLLQRSIGINAIITGLQACESRNRALLAQRYDNNKARYMSKDGVEFCSQRWFTKSTSTWGYHPIMLWSTDDVWKYTHDNDIPVNDVYDKWNGLYLRCGCLPCTAYSSWIDKLPVSHPKLFNRILTRYVGDKALESYWKIFE